MMSKLLKSIVTAESVINKNPLALQVSAERIVTCSIKIKNKCHFLYIYISSFLLLNYNLFVLFIVLFLYFLINTDSVECKGEKVAKEIIRKSGTHYDLLGHFVSMFKGSMYNLKPLSPESLHHFKYMQFCKTTYPNCLYIPLPDSKHSQLCDGVIIDPINKEIIKSIEYKFRFNKPVYNLDLLKYQTKYPFLDILDLGHMFKSNYKDTDFGFQLVSSDFRDKILKELDSDSGEKLKQEMNEVFFLQKSENKTISQLGLEIVKSEIPLIKGSCLKLINHGNN
jgi:hypothetical protein